MIKNKWKLAFWICFSISIFIFSFSIYSIIDQGVTLTYMEEGYSETENDLLALSVIINETDLSKTQIKKALLNKNIKECHDIAEDTISLERIQLIFHLDKLNQIKHKY